AEALTVLHSLADLFNDGLSNLGGNIVPRPRIAPCGRHPDLVAVSELYIFELVPVGVPRWRGEVAFAVETADIDLRGQHIVSNFQELLVVLGRHRFEDANRATGIDEGGGTASSLDCRLLAAAFAGVVPEVHAALGVGSDVLEALDQLLDRR